MSFQILNKEGEAISLNSLDIEAGKFWHGEQFQPDKKYYCLPPEFPFGANWFDVIGYMIHSPMGNYTSGWNNVKCSLWTLHIRGDYDKAMGEFDVLANEIKQAIEYLRPFFALIDHWESKGYQPKQVNE